MGYRSASKLAVRKDALEQRGDLAATLKMARPDHAWTPDLRAKGRCKACGARSPFRANMARHPYTVKEWP